MYIYLHIPLLLHEKSKRSELYFTVLPMPWTGSPMQWNMQIIIFILRILSHFQILHYIFSCDLQKSYCWLRTSKTSSVILNIIFQQTKSLMSSCRILRQVLFLIFFSIHKNLYTESQVLWVNVEKRGCRQGLSHDPSSLSCGLAVSNNSFWAGKNFYSEFSIMKF